MNQRVLSLQPAGYQAWDRFVDARSAGSFYHLSGWREVIDRAYGHPCHFLYTEQDGAISGVLPLVHIRSRLFGNALVSMPFCVYGGVLADDSGSEARLLARASELAEELRVDYLELRNRQPLADLPVKHSHVLFGTALADSDEAILAGIKKKQRAVIRQSLRQSLEHEVDSDLSTFYRIYSESVRNLGTPVFSRRYFALLSEVFAPYTEILTVRHQGQPVSSVLSFYYKHQVLPHYGGGVRAARQLKSNDYMYYQLMCHARRRDCDYFDFGRSKVDSGAFHYKKHWGMAPEPLHYQYHLVRADSLPAVNANNPKYAFFINLWKRLPLVASQWLGPILSRSLG